MRPLRVAHGAEGAQSRKGQCDPGGETFSHSPLQLGAQPGPRAWQPATRWHSGSLAEFPRTGTLRGQQY